MDCTTCTPRKAWELPFLAEPAEVVALRRVLRIHLRIWDLQELTDAVQLCVSELVTNVITHVGAGTPTTLAVSMNGTRLRIEVHDPDTRALPTLVDATDDGETGRGMALVTAATDRWGVQLLADRKVTWCEFDTDLNVPVGQCAGHRVSRLRTVATEAAAIDVISHLLHWLRVHGHDPEDALDRAQMRFEADLGLVGD
ncbi:Anti-sigma regulatory factor (Ser/Thr protein kinase) [Streptomyces sp. 3213]|uniref:ATP-binding protein n=1 Tax=Streptomyces sp. 3213.3 TaxID=1855348 RepID=UPI00089B23D5|nr:ATP-binding protein [Streptomyces sp. 3213.3]SED66987.1 Anti-sigma regulatory factor (Ser/Thr protein kinase) [Streptomyces sp. 3213] [Streptomyces sp. 3213.3]